MEPIAHRARRGRSFRRLDRAISRLALLLLATILPAAQTAYAVEIYHARAIGQEYLPEAEPPAGLPDGNTSPSPPDLPALGEAAEPEPAREGMSVWSKLLIGVVLVAAVAALGDGDGGSAQLNMTPGGSPDPGNAGAPPQGGGDAGSGGTPAGEALPGTDDGDNGGDVIDIGVGDDGGLEIDFDDRDDDDGNRGRGRGRGRGRDRD